MVSLGFQNRELIIDVKTQNMEPFSEGGNDKKE